MDTWRERLVVDLLGQREAAVDDHLRPDGAAQMEIALGIARSEVSYVLELGKSHRLPIGGSVHGDDVWMRVGPATLRFLYDRRSGSITATIPGDAARKVLWNLAKKELVDESGASIEMKEMVREAIDKTVAVYRSAPAPEQDPVSTTLTGNAGNTDKKSDVPKTT